MLEKLWKDGVALSVDIRVWGGDAQMEAEDIGLDKSTLPNIFSMGRKRLVPKENLYPLVAARMKTRSLLLKYGFQMPSGAWFVPWNLVDAVLAEIKGLQESFYISVNDFLEKYGPSRDEFLIQYAPWKDKLEPYYPTVKKLSTKFHYRFFLFQMSTPDNASLSLEDVVRIEVESTAFLKDVVEGLRREATENAKRIIDLIEKGNATKATARAIREFTVRFGNLNFVNDEGVMKALYGLSNAAESLSSETVSAAKEVLKATQTEIENIIENYTRVLVLDD